MLNDERRQQFTGTYQWQLAFLFEGLTRQELETPETFQLLPQHKRC